MAKEITVEQAVTQFHWACALILKHKTSKALNYCVPYAQAGGYMDDPHEIHFQVPYVLSNMIYWRGDVAVKVRKYLKEVQYVLRNY